MTIDEGVAKGSAIWNSFLLQKAVRLERDF